MKINISIDEELVTRIDNYAKKNYMSRSGLISFVCVQYLNSYELMRVVKDLSGEISKIIESGVVDEETGKKLENLKNISNLLVKA